MASQIILVTDILATHHSLVLVVTVESRGTILPNTHADGKDKHFGPKLNYEATYPLLKNI